MAVVHFTGNEEPFDGETEVHQTDHQGTWYQPRRFRRRTFPDWQTRHRDIARQCGAAWRELTPDQRLLWTTLATGTQNIRRDARTVHQLPGYILFTATRFSPEWYDEEPTDDATQDPLPIWFVNNITAQLAPSVLVIDWTVYTPPPAGHPARWDIYQCRPTANTVKQRQRQTRRIASYDLKDWPTGSYNNMIPTEWDMEPGIPSWFYDRFWDGSRFAISGLWSVTPE